MGEKEYRFKYINELGKMKKQKETQQKTELLDLFTTYIYLTNPDYKYNETYLKDMITGFWDDVPKYINKLELREKILMKIKPITISNDIKIQVQIDETWEINYNSSNWDKKISDTPKLTTVDYKNKYVKCKFTDNNRTFFSDYMVSEKDDEIIEFVVKSIEVAKDRMEAELNARANQE